MAKNKYIFDPESLTYIAVDVSLKARAKKFLPYVLAGGFVGIVAYLVMALGLFNAKRKIAGTAD
ncbi:hypothetical protein [Saccharicrinis fermentans]|uniref:Uncharacterized protein n=1 Tax=Saccharicrinis fermentans DSM 9555 = JCM 21142 TaxID=869213 RepID=W7YH12_9BACT|nr:hypothetical protein [Saccharicrinis fermentans]GAF03686.1 hypothetical protein JCM21142_52365 [Saccharicrinis fermentans DSM 9555 = JCM 21142]